MLKILTNLPQGIKVDILSKGDSLELEVYHVMWPSKGSSISLQKDNMEHLEMILSSLVEKETTNARTRERGNNNG